MSSLSPALRSLPLPSASLPLLMLVALSIVFGVIQPNFATMGNASNVAIHAILHKTHGEETVTIMYLGTALESMPAQTYRQRLTNPAMPPDTDGPIR